MFQKILIAEKNGLNMKNIKNKPQHRINLMLPISYMKMTANNKPRKLISHREILFAILYSKLISYVPKWNWTISNTHIGLCTR